MDLLSFLILFIVGLFIFVTQIRGNETRPLFEIYAQRGKWYPLKYIFFLVLVQLRKLKPPKKGSSEVGMGISSRGSDQEMERPQDMPDPKLFPNAVDAVYFNGGDNKHNYIIVAASRRQHSLMQCLTILRLHSVGLLEHPSFPDTNYQTSFPDSFRKDDLHIQCLETMKTWKIDYNGKMLLKPADGKEAREVNVTMNLTWEATHGKFDFDTDQDIHVLADSVARETWSKEFFDRLQGIHQTHYEQFGEVKGTVTINDIDKYEICLQGARDHSYGNHRVWADIYRYGLQYIYLEDSSCLAIGCVSMPKYLSNLVIGFLCKKNGQIIPVRQSDFVLYNLGQDGTPPKEFRIKCIAGGEELNVNVRVIDQSVFHMGTNAEAKVFERFCDFEVNGVKGWGVSEWAYRMVDTWPTWSA